jgi:hypothetical protein
LNLLLPAGDTDTMSNDAWAHDDLGRG